MEPSTPPAHSTGFPATPATPRFGVWEDHDINLKRVTDLSHHGHAGHGNPTADKPVPTNGFLTPRTTPHRRVIFPPVTPVRGSGRQGKRLATPTKTANVKPGPLLKAPALPHTPHTGHRTRKRLDEITPEVGATSVTPRKANAPAVYTSQASPPMVPAKYEGRTGLWYVFRGKKVFRPFDDKNIPDITPTDLFPGSHRPSRLKPKTLFSAIDDSEDDTDIEWA